MPPLLPAHRQRRRTVRPAQPRSGCDVLVPTGPRTATLRRAVTLTLAALLAPAGVAAAPADAPAAVASPVDRSWRWPLDGAPEVVRGFQPPPEPWLAGHRGADLRGSPGDAVRAAGRGQVTFAGPVAGKPVVVVTHPGGLRTTYEPVVAEVSVGEEVAAGAVVGRLSAAGSHCFPLACLHWGLRRGEAYLDPLALLGAHLRVRLLPVWGRGVGSSASARGVPVTAPVAPNRAPPGPRDATRVGALNRARASPFSGQVRSQH